jgi:DNA-directed RNA polymerase subunit RPC12/RpoP
MSDSLDNHPLPVTCPKCGARIEKTVSWLRENDRIDCPCGTAIHLATGEVMAATEALQSARARISRSPLYAA